MRGILPADIGVNFQSENRRLEIRLIQCVI